MIFCDDDTIIAPATPMGGALCVIRLSGGRAIEVCDEVFRGRRALNEAKTATVHYGNIVDGDDVVDDVLVSVFRAPHSYTGENSVEISAHGSRYVVGRIMSLFTARGMRMAEAGEFTRRAFLSGKMDLSQAEAVADVIASDSRASHAVASTQMRGAYSDELGALRDKLLQITSLLELELDFSEEDVEFADRAHLEALLQQTHSRVEQLAESFALGNVLKEGVGVAIVGRPNVGKSTLLNRLIGEDRAMVSNIAGTTRDTIEVVKNIGGIRFRFIDTAGMHTTTDELEQMGIARTIDELRRANVILWLTDDATSQMDADMQGYEPTAEQIVVKVVTKIDLADNAAATPSGESDATTVRLSAKTGEGVDELLERLLSAFDADSVYRGDVVVSSQRHYEALRLADESLRSAQMALRQSLPADLLSEDIRQVLYHLGTITGQISSDEILQNIFSHFCIGK
ncbi:MAG: tRNA uridine-5-carboxymethylaminomethyl(34) synthesis GTPase MnmE [Alistipes sp.]|nr:tRNA uridine-5-carboxymethylaminomethyl(34) synthesis GTPase MnmE [Alistipes sp.]